MPFQPPGDRVSLRRTPFHTLDDACHIHVVKQIQGYGVGPPLRDRIQSVEPDANRAARRVASSAGPANSLAAGVFGDPNKADDLRSAFRAPLLSRSMACLRATLKEPLSANATMQTSTAKH